VLCCMLHLNVLRTPFHAWLFFFRCKKRRGRSSCSKPLCFMPILQTATRYYTISSSVEQIDVPCQQRARCIEIPSYCASLYRCSCAHRIFHALFKVLLSVLAERRGARHQSIPLLATQKVDATDDASETCIVFCETKLRCAEVAQILSQEGAGALPLHGDLEQSDRERVSSLEL